MKKIINNVNKLALVALALFVTVGVVSCGCDDKKEGDKKDKVKVTISVDKSDIAKALRTGAGVSAVAGTASTVAGTLVAFTEPEITVKVTLKVDGEGSFDKEQLKKLVLKADGFMKDALNLKDGKNLDELGVPALAKGTDAVITIKWTNGLADMAALNAATVALNGAANDTPSNDARKAASGDKDITLTGEGVEAEKKTVKVKLTPQE